MHASALLTAACALGHIEPSRECGETAEALFRLLIAQPLPWHVYISTIFGPETGELRRGLSPTRKHTVSHLILTPTASDTSSCTW